MLLRNAALTAIFCVSASIANATVLDFIDHIDNVSGETGGDPLVLGPSVYVPVATTANGYTGSQASGITGSAYVAYGDFREAGIGVCKTLGAPSQNAGANECASGADDDNLQDGEILGLSWMETLLVNGVGFSGENHPDDALGQNDQFAYSLDGTSWSLGQLIEYDQASNSGFYMFGAPLRVEKGQELYFAYENEQYYVAAMDVTSPVPVPAAGLLLVGGLGALGAMRKRRNA